MKRPKCALQHKGSCFNFKQLGWYLALLQQECFVHAALPVSLLVGKQQFKDSRKMVMLGGS